jgi:hypothetical protein
MLTAEAVIQTEHPDRYLARLCKHASQMAGTFTSAPPRWRAGISGGAARRVLRQSRHGQAELGSVDHAGRPRKADAAGRSRR